MTLAASIALLSGGVACYVAVLSRQLSRAPGWIDQRHFSLAAIAVAGYAVLNVPTTAPILSDQGVVLCTRIQMVLAAVHTYAWLRYSSALVGDARREIERVAVPVLAVVAAVGILTPFFFTGAVRFHTFAPIGAVYRTAVSTPTGDLAYAVTLGLLAVPVGRLGRAWRRGVPNAGIQLAALVVLLLMGVNDTLVQAGAYPAPYLVDLAFLLPVVAVAYALTERFVEDARALAALRQDLERQVGDRTAELGRAQDALHRAEKLAALGQFAAGVAHEVNNPAAVLSANLQFISSTESDGLSEDGKDALEESLQSVHRIAGIVKQLLDAGRLAATAEPARSVPLRPLGDSATSVARARFGRRVHVANTVEDGIFALGHENVIGQVLVNLVVNAVQAIPAHRTDGKVFIAAEATGDRVRLVVEDNGSGMEPEVLRRAFEPFFTTKAFGSGSGLGLAVSRGLVVGLGGDLYLESEAGRGTRAVVELPAAGPPAAGRARRLAEQPAGPKLRMLVVDDEASVLSSLRRLLSPRYGIEVASGVEEGLARLEAEGFDLVLCDVMMPGGGGERLYRSLVDRSPHLAERVVFVTGGAVTDAARTFLRSQPQPVLHKPFDLEQLARAAEQVRPLTAGPDVTRH
jgi:signal transduction histidine kinase/CheY-like chemotaxis protein